MSNTIGEHGRALLIAAQVFESHSWSDFEGLLPDLEFLPTFGQEVGGETSGAGGISPTKCIMYPNEFSSCLMNALWLPECPPLTTIKAIVEKSKEDPLKRNVCAFADADGYLPLHVCAGVVDEMEIVEYLLQEYPKATQIKDNDGMRPLDIILRGGIIEGRPTRKNADKVRDSIEKVADTYRRMYTCYSCGKDCNESLVLKKCSACKYVSYCSVGCQKSNWKKHRPVCMAKRAPKVLP